jgi:hypothetical protein
MMAAMSGVMAGRRVTLREAAMRYGASTGILQIPGRPEQVADVPGLVASGRLPIDVVLLQVSGPDDAGRYNAGLGIEHLHAAIARARLVIAQVNPELPWTCGETVIAPGSIDILVPAAAPPLALPARSAGPSARAIAEHIARLIPDRATLELGLGVILEAVAHALGGKRGLGVHSGAIGDGIAELMEAGLVDNRHKEIDPGTTVATMLMGTQLPYRFADRNESIRIRATSYTHDAMMRWCSAIPAALLRPTGARNRPDRAGQRGDRRGTACRSGRRADGFRARRQSRAGRTIDHRAAVDQSRPHPLAHHRQAGRRRRYHPARRGRSGGHRARHRRVARPHAGRTRPCADRRGRSELPVRIGEGERKAALGGASCISGISMKSMRLHRSSLRFRRLTGHSLACWRQAS